MESGRLKLKKLEIERKEYGIDIGKMLGEITFQNQYAKVSVKLNEDQAYRILEVVQDALVTSAHETAALLVSDIGRPQAAIEPAIPEIEDLSNDHRLD